MRIRHRFHALIPAREREFLAFIRRAGPNDTHDGNQAVNLAHVAHAAQARHRGRFDMMHRPCAATGNHLPHLRVLPRLLPRFSLTLTRNLTLTLRSSIKSRIKIKSKKSPAESAGVVTLTTKFVKGLLSFFRMHWAQEPPDRAVASWTGPVLWRFRSARLHCQSARRLAHSKTWRGFRQFMERLTSRRERGQIVPRHPPRRAA